MNQRETVRLLYESEGKSLNEIVRITGYDFRTVKKYATQDDWREPEKQPLKPENYTVLGPYIETIDAWLELDKKAPRGQRHTAQRVFDRLRKEKGYKGSYDSIKRYMRRKRELEGRVTEGFLPLAQPPCHAQVDFGSFAYFDASGTQRCGHALDVSFPHSNAGWMQVFPSENQECLLEGLRRIFYYIGGVPHRLRADNMTTAVAQVLKGRDRIVSEGFRRFMLHHRFAADFCNPAAGNEKGNVENKVGYLRRNLLTPVPLIEDFEAFNRELLARCDANHNRQHYRHGKLISALWEEERRGLYDLPQYEYEVFRYESAVVSKTGFVSFDTNRYSVSPQFAGVRVQAKLWFDKIEVFHNHQRLKTFRRSYGRNEECIDWRDYMPLLMKKPHAVAETRFFDQMPKLWQRHLLQVQGSERKSALMLLNEMVQQGHDELCDEVLGLASQHGQANTESIRQCYTFITQPEFHPQPLQLAQAPTQLANYAPDLSVYDALIGVAA